MAAKVFNLATERPRRVMEKALANAEASAGEAAQELARLRQAIDDLGIDRRALVLLNALKQHFAGCDGVLIELDYLKTLLKPAGSNLE